MLLTVTVKGTDIVVLVRTAGFGPTAQFAPPVAPVQVSWTEPVKPPTEFSVTLNVAVPPAAMVCEVDAAVKLKGAVMLTMLGPKEAEL